MIMSPPSDSPAAAAKPLPPPHPLRPKRGAFILFEGVDRCGKTTQCSLLLRHLLGLSIAAVAMRFPDRATPIGELVNGYLASGNDLDDRAVHLLFSSNRWEASGKLGKTLGSGTTVVCDRYAYSGVAFSSAKVEEGTDKPMIDIEWCKSPDVGLPAPDCVIFLDIEQEEAEKRGGYGGERYEKRDMQIRVREKFGVLRRMDENSGRVPWHVINAARTVEEVQSDINKIVEKTLKDVSEGNKPMEKMWEEGHYDLPAEDDSADGKKS
mmetsp:Transcript_12652/g.37285  ORF Transcript_12652/g.37285 Transcript_12652/m.37285 type:complete len:266 (-) Transcript_12652:155-952(-)